MHGAVWLSARSLPRPTDAWHLTSLPLLLCLSWCCPHLSSSFLCLIIFCSLLLFITLLFIIAHSRRPWAVCSPLLPGSPVCLSISAPTTQLLCAPPPEGAWPVKQPLFSVRHVWRAALLPYAAWQASDKLADEVPLSQAPIFHAVDWDHRSGVSCLSLECRCPTVFCAGTPFSHTVHILQCISLVTSAPEDVLLISPCLFPHLWNRYLLWVELCPPKRRCSLKATGVLINRGHLDTDMRTGRMLHANEGRDGVMQL